MKKMIYNLFIMLAFSIVANAQFTSDPSANTQLSDLSGEQAIPKIAVCSDGSMFVSWFSYENSNYNMRMQYLDANGNPQWENNGLLISDEEQMSWLTDYSLTTDPVNHAIVTFQDIRTGFNNPVGYRVSPAGEKVWGEEGVLLSDNENMEPDPVVCATGEGNIIFAWQSLANASEVHMQKVSPEGELLWGDGIVLAESGVEYTSPFLQSADGDHAYLIWHKETGPFWAPNRGLYVQKLNTDGSFMWAESVEIYAPVPSGAVAYLEMCRDNDGGIIFSWYGNDAGTHFNCWVQHMATDGSLSMAANGVVVSTSMSQNHMYPSPAYLPATDEIIVYFSEQDLNQNQRGLYAQKFDMQGNRLWTDNAKELIPLSDNDYALPDAGGYMDMAICVYGAFEFGNASDEKVQAVMLNSNGDFVWEEDFIDMSTVQSAKTHRVLSPLTNGQWVAVWGDERNGNRDIYAQNIHPDGTIGPGTVSEGKIQGFVRDAVTNISIESATITATNADDSYQTIETPFGSHYSFMVPAGIYDMTCEATGYQMAEASGMEVMADEIMNHTFYLEPVDHITGSRVNPGINVGISPNPFAETIKISHELQGDVYFKLLDGSGRVVLESRIDSPKVIIQTTYLKRGIYYYQVLSGQEISTGKLVKGN